MLKTLATKKLFYKKYAFKIACYLKGASQVKYRGADWIIKRYNGMSQEDARKISIDISKWRTNEINYPELVLFAKTVKKWIKNKDIHIRCEGGHYNLFCSDLKTFDKIVKDLDPWVKEVTRPETDEDLAFFTANGPSKVLVNDLPHGKFKYKIVMKPSMTADRRTKFKGWLDRYNVDPKAISHNTRMWLTNNRPYVQDPFFYVENDEMLTMINLYLGNIISRTEEFVLRNEAEPA